MDDVFLINFIKHLAMLGLCCCMVFSPVVASGAAH